MFPSLLKRSMLRYNVVLIIQIVLIVLFYVFTRYPKDVSEIKEVQGFGEIHVMIFVGFGFLMSFLKKYSYTAIGFNLLLAAIAVQLALFFQPLFMEGAGSRFAITKINLIEADVLAATVLITFGALLGIASGMQLIVITVIEIIVAALNLYFVSKLFKASDVGGSIAIHAFGAYFGLGVSAGLRKKLNTDLELCKPTYVGDITAMIGTLFLWIYWPFFNAALTESVNDYDKAIVHTYLALSAATVTTFFLSAAVSSAKGGKLDMVHIQNSTLAGGVAVGSICNMNLEVGGALVVGSVSAVISVLGYRFLTPLMAKLGIQDTCGVHNLHGMPGLLSGLLSVLFAHLDGGSSLNQFYATIATVAFAIITGTLTGLLLRLKIFENLSDEERFNDEINWELPE